jgi:tetratricopeptide (TPR) repeat protein
MKRVVNIILIVTILHLFAHTADAAQITVMAEDIKGIMVKNVIFVCIATGAKSPPTTTEGRTKVALPDGVKPGQRIELQVSRVSTDQPDWVFLSPWDRMVSVHAAGEYTKIVLVRRGDRDALQSGEFSKAMAHRILAEIGKASTPDQPVTEQQRHNILVAEAMRVGLKPEEVDHAIRIWKERAQDPYDIGIAALYDGNYPKAAEQLAKSLKLREEQEAEFREKVADAAYFLGQALSEQGQYVQATESYRKALERRPDDAFTMNAYGMALVQAGNYNEAESQLKRSLEIAEKTWKDHREVATSLNNLAVLYRKQGRYAAAEPLFKQSLEIAEKTLGKDHRDVGASLNNLALLYIDQGRYAAAEPLFKQSLEIAEKALGKDHRDVATSLGNLALLYDKQGR